jgi:iron-siderophore transport system permease protein
MATAEAATSLPPVRSPRETVARARAAARARPRRVGFVLATVTLLVFCVSVAVGDYPISLLDVVPALLGAGDPASVVVAQDLRLPRALNGVLVGAALGLSGAIFQSIARNPLASPDILGVLYGSAVVAVFVITTVGASFAALYAGALAGAVGMGVLVYVLAFRRGVSPYRFVLVGMSLGLMASSVTFVLITRSDLYSAAQATVWLTGSLNSAGWETVAPTGVLVLLLAPATVALGARLRALQLGDDVGRGLGVELERSRLALLMAAMALAGAGTAAAGPVAFVAFMAAPIARRLTRAPVTLVPAALTGALLVIAADLLGRRLFAPAEIPVGVITGIAGAPYLLWLLARTNRAGAGG